MAAPRINIITPGMSERRESGVEKKARMEDCDLDRAIDALRSFEDMGKRQAQAFILSTYWSLSMAEELRELRREKRIGWAISGVVDARKAEPQKPPFDPALMVVYDPEKFKDEIILRARVCALRDIMATFFGDDGPPEMTVHRLIALLEWEARQK
jgi:hypothetical protein